MVNTDTPSNMAGGNATINKHNIPIDAPFVTALLNGRTSGIALKGGNAVNGPLLTLYDGARCSPLA